VAKTGSKDGLLALGIRFHRSIPQDVF